MNKLYDVPTTRNMNEIIYLPVFKKKSIFKI